MGLFSSTPPTQDQLQKRLAKSISDRNIQRLKAALQAGARIDLRCGEYKTALQYAVRRNFGEGVDHILSLKPDMAGEPADMILTAVENASFYVVHSLTHYGFDVNVKRPLDESTPLHIAAAAGRDSFAKLLIQAGADVEAVNNYLRTPADEADARYPRLADYIRKQMKPKLLAAASADEWKLTATDEVARISLRPALGYKLTEIFNFGLHTYRSIALNLETGQETQVVKGFGAFASDDTAIDRAFEKFSAMGGDMAQAPRHLSKSGMQFPSGGG